MSASCQPLTKKAGSISGSEIGSGSISQWYGSARFRIRTKMSRIQNTANRASKQSVQGMHGKRPPFICWRLCRLQQPHPQLSWSVWLTAFGLSCPFFPLCYGYNLPFSVRDDGRRGRGRAKKDNDFSFSSLSNSWEPILHTYNIRVRAMKLPSFYCQRKDIKNFGMLCTCSWKRIACRKSGEILSYNYYEWSNIRWEELKAFVYLLPLLK